MIFTINIDMNYVSLGILLFVLIILINKYWVNIENYILDKIVMDAERHG